MPIASYQKKVFQVSANKMNLLNNLAWSSSIDTESVDKLKDKPSTYIKGPALGKMSFDITLRASAKVNVRAEIEQWEAICAKGAADEFVLGNKKVGANRWLLTGVDVSDLEIDNRGRIIGAAIKLSLDEYVRAGKKTDGGAGTPGGQYYGQPSQAIMDPPDKSGAKRNNLSQDEAMQRMMIKDKMYGYEVD